MRTSQSARRATRIRTVLAALPLLLLPLLASNRPALAGGGVKNILPSQSFSFAEVSDQAINRIHCFDDVTGVVYPQEKPLEVKTRGKDVFIRYTADIEEEVIPEPKSSSVASMDNSAPTMDMLKPPPMPKKSFKRMPPIEMYVFCGLETYSLTIMPVRDPTPYTIILGTNRSPDRSKISQKERGVPYEAMLSDLLKSAYIGDPPTHYEVKQHNRAVGAFLQGELVKAYEWIGDRFVVVTYLLSNNTRTEMSFAESQFVELEKQSLAISMTHNTVEPGESIRVFIVRSRSDAD